jgi:integration host factor subunit beta
VTKSDLIEIVSEKSNITRVRAEKVVETVFDSMKEALKGGERIEIRGFGSFEVRHYGAYEGRNPKTGEILQVQEKRLPFFRVGKQLKAQLVRK